MARELEGLRKDKSATGKAVLADFLADAGSPEVEDAVREARLVLLVEEALKLPYGTPDTLKYIAGNTYLYIHVCSANTSFALVRYEVFTQVADEQQLSELKCDWRLHVIDGVPKRRYVVWEFGRRRAKSVRVLRNHAIPCEETWEYKDVPYENDVDLTHRKVKDSVRLMKESLDYYEDKKTKEKHRNPEKARLLKLTLDDLIAPIN